MRHVSSVITVVKNHYSVIDFAYEEEEEEEERASERASVCKAFRECARTRKLFDIRINGNEL